MSNPTPRRTTTSPLATSISRSRLQHHFCLVPLSLAFASFFALALSARAVTPAPDGSYPNQNTAEGDNALFTLTTGAHNTAIGFEALVSHTTGNGNTANGYRALYYNTDGDYNTAIGDSALFNNTDGGDNTATGASALFRNTTGLFNTANGVAALYSNTTANSNTANGYRTLFSNTTGFENTATGDNALSSNTTGNSNTANGYRALVFNKTGSYNTATGYQALYFNKTGIDNTGEGNFALYSNTTGSNNTAIGLNALYYTTGSSNIALGFAAGINLTTGNNNIDIGNYGVARESNKIRIGTVGIQKATFIAGINGVTVPRGVGVIVGSDGQLGTVVSSERFKDGIRPMDKASEAILALQPVTFRYKHELDPEGIAQFGLVAEQVEKVNPDLVARDDEGKAYTVRYEAVNAMLLNEFLKEHRAVQEQGATISSLELTVAQQQKQIEALATAFQKTSDQLRPSNVPPSRGRQ